MQFNLARAFDTLVETLADRECIVWKDRRLTYGQVADRSRRLGSYLHARGLGVRTEREHLAGHESGQDHLALALYNGNEYLEGMLGSYRGPGRPLQRQLPLRGRGTALPTQRRHATRPHLARIAGPNHGRGAAHPRVPTRRPLAGGRRFGPRPAAGCGRLRGGPGRLVTEGRPGRGLARRSLHSLHRRDDRYAQGCAVAPARHLHGRHGRAEGRHLGDRHQLRGHHRAAGQQLSVEVAAPAPAHARRGAVVRVHADGPGGHPRLPRRPPPDQPR